MTARTLTKGGRRREQILNAAVALFGEAGYRGTSLRDIANRVGITHPGLLYHFRSKQELLSAVLERRDGADGGAAALLEECTDGRELAQRVLQLTEDTAATPGMIELFATLSAESTYTLHPAHDFFQARYERIVAIYQTMFDRLSDQDYLREGIETAGLGSNFVALMDGLQVQWLYAPDSFSVPGRLKSYLNSLLKTPL